MSRAALLVTVFFVGCGTPLDTTRDPVDKGSFGSVAYTLACKRLAWSEDRADGDGKLDVTGDTYRSFCRNGTAMPQNAYASVRALDGERPDLIAALDDGFPEEDLDPLQRLLARNAFLSLYDDGTAETVAEKLAELFTLMAEDTAAAGALARLDGRFGYRPSVPAIGLLRPVARFDKLDELLDSVPAALGPGGAAHEEFLRLQLAVSRELVDVKPVAGPADPQRTLNLAVDFLLTESTLFPAEQPRNLTRRDFRGLSVVEKDGASFPAPFVDMNADGLADADAQGRFVDAAGRPVTAPAPFVVPWLPETAPRRDAAGRALTSAGRPIYRTVDVDRTLLAALARDARELFSPTRGTALDLLRSSASLLGRRVTVRKTYTGGATLEYRGFEPAGSALLDMAHAYLQLLAEPDVDDSLALTRTLIVDHEPTAARLLEALLATADLGKQFPEAQLAPGSALYDDLIPVVNRILAVPGLTEDILRALEDPAMRGLGKRFRDLMTYKDSIDFDPDTQQVVGSMHTPVDRSQPDSGFNRSLLQRILHMLNDSAGHRFCNRDGAIITFFGFPTTFPYDECELLYIDDLAVFFVQSIAYAKDAQGRVLHDEHGRPLPKALLPIDLPGYLEPFVDDDLMEGQAGIDGFRFHPTPQALARTLFLSPPPDFIADVMDPAVCKDGDRYQSQHSGSLAALELNGTYDQIRPLVQAFADHDAERLFVDVLVVLHSHWPSRNSLQHQGTNPGGHGYAKRSDIHAWEPLVARVLEEDALWSALTSGAATLNAIQLPSGRMAPEVLAAKARHVFGPQGLAKRNGQTTSTTEDGRPITSLSPWHLLADAYKAKRTQLAAAPGEGELWQRAGGQVLDVLARGEAVGSSWRFRNPRFRGTVAAVADFLGRRIAAHRTTGDLGNWLGRELPGDLERIMTGPVYAGAADLVLSLSATPEARASLEELLVHLTTDATALDAAATVAADMLQWYACDADLVPLTRLLGKAIDPERGLVDALLDFAAKARAADDKGVVADLMARLEGEVVPGRTPLMQIVDSITEVHREKPFADQGKAMTAADYKKVFTTVAGFLSDEKRGLMKFTAIVKNRAGGENE